MEFVRAGVFALGVLLALTATGWAHFQVITPSTDTVTDQTGGKIEIALLFTHPMERGPVMQMEKPVRFGVKTGAAITDLAGQLRPTTVDGKQAWQASYDIKQPADYVFFVEPKPYWEPA
jgi:nickel transport protein